MQIDGVEVERLQAVDLRPGDLLVVEIKGLLPAAVRERFRTYLKDTFGDEQRVLLLEEGTKLNVVRPVQP